nr:MAG TPA: hypothetical protein [Bacteriophage sp.]
MPVLAKAILVSPEPNRNTLSPINSPSNVLLILELSSPGARVFTVPS